MKKTILICLLAAAVTACGAKQQNAAAGTTGSQSASAQPSKFKLPSDHPPIGAANANAPAALPVANAPASAVISGKVAETINAGGYTYVKVATGNRDVWAAVPQTELKVGAPVNVSVQMTMEKFESKTLKRSFDSLVFGTLAGPGTAQPAAMASAMGTPNAGTPAQHITGGAANVGDVKVEKAAGGKTVAETYAASSGLKDKPVVIRGKVVKSLSGIMGKNWLHLRDGSGSKDKGDNDITITSNDTAAVGDVVTVSGVVRVDKDFGAGYRYPVIIEEAKISKQ